MIAHPFVVGFFSNLGWATFAMLLVLAIRKPFASLFGAGPAYALWLLPALRLIAPPLPGLAPDLPPIVPAETLVVWAGDAAAPLPPDVGPGQWVPWMLALWAGGAAVFLLWHLRGYRRFLTELSLSSRSVGKHRGLPLVESEAVPGPLALGLLDRRIVVPADFESRYSANERALALEHEAVHHHRGDIWWNHIGLLILALNWFNSIAWVAFRAFRADQETACDARVTANASPEARHDYARALVKSASRPGLIAACPLNHADQLKRRLRMMKDHRTSRARMLGGGAVILGLAGLGLALGSPGIAAEQGGAQAQAETPAPRTERREERIVIHTDRHDGAPAAAGDGNRERRRVIIREHRDGGEGHAAHGGETHPNVVIHTADRDALTARCNNRERTEVNEGDTNQRTRIIVCGNDNATPAERAERLQGVRDRLARDEELSTEQRTRVTAAIDREIARLRGQ